MHKKHEILPCAFPHADYLNQNNVKPFKEEIGRSAKLKVCPIRRINPKDDSNATIDRVQKQNTQRMTFKSKLTAKKKQNNQAKKYEKKKAKLAAIKSEIDGLKEAKQMLASTADQYSTMSGIDLTHELFNPVASQSIASRTRRKSKTNSPDKTSPKIQYTVRKSQRAIKTKRLLDF